MARLGIEARAAIIIGDHVIAEGSDGALYELTGGKWLQLRPTIGRPKKKSRAGYFRQYRRTRAARKKAQLHSVQESPPIAAE